MAKTINSLNETAKSKPCLLLTGDLYRYFKKKGYTFVCPWCVEPITLGDMVVPCRGRGIFHKPCWDGYCAQASGARRQLPIPLGYKPKSPTPYIILRKGECVSNPHFMVLCPKLLAGHPCKKYDKHHEFRRPELLLKHHADPNLQLWKCVGCPGFLLRVQIPC